MSDLSDAAPWIAIGAAAAAVAALLVSLAFYLKLRAVRKYAGLSTYLYVKMNEEGAKLGIKWGELSWTLEDNAPVNVAIKFMGGKVYKKYRVFERDL